MSCKVCGADHSQLKTALDRVVMASNVVCKCCDRFKCEGYKHHEREAERLRSQLRLATTEREQLREDHRAALTAIERLQATLESRARRST